MSHKSSRNTLIFNQDVPFLKVEEDFTKKKIFYTIRRKLQRRGDKTKQKEYQKLRKEWFLFESGPNQNLTLGPNPWAIDQRYGTILRLG